jgi:hypothetical protein
VVVLCRNERSCPPGKLSKAGMSRGKWLRENEASLGT